MGTPIRGAHFYIGTAKDTGRNQESARIVTGHRPANVVNYLKIVGKKVYRCQKLQNTFQYFVDSINCIRSKIGLECILNNGGIGMHLN